LAPTHCKKKPEWEAAMTIKILDFLNNGFRICSETFSAFVQREMGHLSEPQAAIYLIFF
jgi:hypothetical protein